MDVVWIIACVRNPDLVDAESQPFVDEFWADPLAWRDKYTAEQPADAGAVHLLVEQMIGA